MSDQIPIKTCSQCKESKPYTIEYFERRGNRLRGTCKECRRRRKTLPKEKHRFICTNCQKEYFAKEANRNKFCSRECYFDFIKSRNDQKKRTEPLVVKCRVCGNFFETTKNKVYCSNDCRRLSAKQRHQATYRPAREINPFVRKECKHCGKEFVTNFYADVREFCSKKCGKKHWKRQRRAQKRRQYVEEVHLMYIYKRDRGRCCLCGEKVDLKKSVPHPMSATLDHIIPLTLGGKHERKNVQLAHFACNTKKGARIEGQLMLFG